MNDRGRCIRFVAFLLLALMFSCVIGPKVSNPDTYEYLTNSLDEKKNNVEKLAGAAAGASAVITLMPGDFGTPIADKLVDLSGCFLLILCAVYVEKFLVSMTGVLFLGVLLPIGLILTAAGEYTGKSLKAFGHKIIALSMILVLLAPTSIMVSDLIERQHSTEIEQTINSMNSEVSNIQGAADQADSDNSSVWSQFIQSVKGGSEALLKKLQDVLNSTVDLVAIYIVTSCIVPAACFMVGIWLIKMLFQLETPDVVKIVSDEKEHLRMPEHHRLPAKHARPKDDNFGDL